MCVCGLDLSNSAMERLLAKIGMPSYLPTPAEVVEGVRWLRENPALAAGVVVGLTSYSVAKYYEYDEEEEEDVEEARQLLASLSADDSGGMHGETRATREEIAKSVSAIQLGLVKKASSSEERPSIVDSTASTQSSMGSLSGGLRSRASSVFDRALLEVC